MPNEHASHAAAIATPAGLAAFGAAMAGLFLATLLYLWRTIDARGNPAHIRADLQAAVEQVVLRRAVRRRVRAADACFCSAQIARFDRDVIDGSSTAWPPWPRAARAWSTSLFDRTVVDGSVNTFASWTWDFGLLLRKLQTGSLRQYVMFIVVGTWFCAWRILLFRMS